MTDLDNSNKVGLFGRAKALGVLVLPFLAFAVVVFLASTLVRIHPAGVPKRASEPTPISADGWLSADTASSAGASVEVRQTLQGVTTVKTYTVMGKF